MSFPTFGFRERRNDWCSMGRSYRRGAVYRAWRLCCGRVCVWLSGRRCSVLSRLTIELTSSPIGKGDLNPTGEFSGDEVCGISSPGLGLGIWLILAN